MPLFPGPSAEPFHDLADYLAVVCLGTGFASIAAEARRLVLDNFLACFPRDRLGAEALATAESGMWKLFLSSHFGSGSSHRLKLVLGASFEHETRNENSINRAVMIVDVWHSDPTEEGRMAYCNCLTVST